MSKPGNTGFARVVAAAGYSWQGLIAAFRHEAAFRQELALIALALPTGLWAADDGVESLLIAATLLLVLIVELINSAIEATVDLWGEQRHELAGRAKDCASAAVMLSIILACAVWISVVVF